MMGREGSVWRVAATHVPVIGSWACPASLLLSQGEREKETERENAFSSLSCSLCEPLHSLQNCRQPSRYRAYNRGGILWPCGFPTETSVLYFFIPPSLILSLGISPLFSLYRAKWAQCQLHLQPRVTSAFFFLV